MGRKRTVHKDLPRRMHLKAGTYWHVSSGKPRRWTKLDRHFPIALRFYADIEGSKYPERDVTFKDIARRYRREVFPTKAPQTQRDNEKELKNLEAVFGDLPIDAIKPRHVRQYLDIRGQKAKVRANRERALLSHVFNSARQRGYTDAANPCAGVKGHRESGRDRYVTDEEFRAVWQCAHFTVQDAMDLAYYTAQRPGDVIRLNRSDVRDGELWFKQAKTGQRVRVKIEGAFAEVIERIAARPRRASGLSLIQDDDGQPVTHTALRSRFDAARRAARVSFQFRDIRAKAASDLEDLAHAQRLLVHKRRATTEHYAGRRKGDRVAPVARTLESKQQTIQQVATPLLESPERDPVRES